MIEQVIPWNTGGGNVVVSYEGKGKGELLITSPDNPLWEDRSMTIIVETTAGSPEKAETIVLAQKGKTLDVGTKFDFDYTGAVQSVELPKGKYKLQCWGAQGGTSYGSPSAAGSKGGYSEGVLALDKTTTLYVFVGGKGSRGTSSSLVNGGWNGGGAAVGFSSYGGSEYGESYPACGGGATDIALVTSSMSYSNGRTNRTQESLLSRIIVAGGGAGGSYAYQEIEEIIENTEYYDKFPDSSYADPAVPEAGYFFKYDGSFVKGASFDVNGINYGWLHGIDTTSNRTGVWVVLRFNSGSDVSKNSVYITYEVTESTTETYTDSRASNKSQQGGGTSGKGQYPGTQSSAGGGGAFGLGANQTTTNYRYCSGAGGGGWYGGGIGYSDGSIGYVNNSGGGSGFVNTVANAPYRPSGYTGLQLDSGSTTAGNSSHPSTSGGTETGHSGNGYARITVL